jgi:molecular chaperone DnaJ
MAEEYRADWADKDFYAELGVTKSATTDEIKKAYRKLARANHPDNNPGDSSESRAKHEKFKKVAEAYDVVGDPEKRKKYDEFRSMYSGGGYGAGYGFRTAGRPGSAGAYSANFNFEDFFNQATGGGSAPGGSTTYTTTTTGGGQGGGQAGGIGDMFGDLFGGGFRRTSRARPQKGQDIESNATISFLEALEGVTISLRLSSDSPCPDCAGTGGKPGTKPRVCPECDGSGYVTARSGGGFAMNETCPRCHGRQLIYDEPCPTCHGTGRGTSSRSIQARIPAGVKDGSRIRLRNKGASGENGGPAGDLYVTVRVTPDRVFGRKDDNLTLEVPISFDEAVLGADIKIPTLGGAPVTLKIPAGTPTGRTFRVRGKGATRSDGTKGDLLATVEVQVPAGIDAKTREAVEAYREAVADKPLRTNLFEDS